MEKKYILRAAVAACFGAVAGQAVAAVDLGVSPVTGTAKVAKEIPSNAGAVANPAGQLNILVKVPAGYDVNGANPLYVKLDLTNGAKFVGANPTFACTGASGGDGTTAVGAITLGGLGNSNVVFQIDSADVTGGHGPCTVTLNASGVSFGSTAFAAGAIGVSATVEYKSGLNNTVTGAAGNLVSFVRGLSADILSAAGSVIVDATSGSDNFDSVNSNSGASFARLGSFFMDAHGTSATTAGVAGNITLAEALSTASITINGPSLAAALADNDSAGVFLAATGATCSAGFAAGYKYSSKSGSSVTFNNVAPGDIATGLAVCLNVSGGTNVIAAGQHTASITGTAQANVTLDYSAASDKLETVTSNGTTKNAYMVNASTSASKTSVVRMVNTGAVSATFTATAYAVDDGTGAGAAVAGTTLGTANAALGTLAAGGSLSLTSAQLESKLGFTPSSGSTKYRVVISAGTNAFKVLNFTRDIASGAIVLTQSQDD